MSISISSNQNSWLGLDKGEEILFNCYSFDTLNIKLMLINCNLWWLFFYWKYLTDLWTCIACWISFPCRDVRTDVYGTVADRTLTYLLTLTSSTMARRYSMASVRKWHILDFWPFLFKTHLWLSKNCGFWVKTFLYVEIWFVYKIVKERVF